MATRSKLLGQIIETARANKVAGHPIKAIFDLDSTLFDVSPRISKILNAFAALPETQNRFPEQAGQLAKLTPHAKDYGVRRTLERAEFILPKRLEEQLEFQADLVEYWKNQFFGNDFLIYDRPYPGALEFVLDLAAAGSEIYYLTGRDTPRMGQGTIDSLKSHGFPLSKVANLIMKPSNETKDTIFKRDFFMQMEKSQSEVWFFENEPANIQLVLKNSPHVKIVFVDTVHSGAAPLPDEAIPRINGFEE